MLYLTFSCTSLLLGGQTDIAPAAAPPELLLEYFVTDAEVRLRWRAASASTWAENRATGYVLERRKLTGGGPEQAWQSLTIAPVLEADLSEWVALIQRDSLLGIAGSMLYENGRKTDYLSNDGSRAGLLQQAENLNNAYLYLLVGCDLGFAASEAAGMGLRDPDVVAGNYYQYRVKTTGEAPILTSAAVTVRAGQRTPLPPVNELSVDFGDRSATLTFTPPPFKYPSFDVLRANGPEGPWQRVNPQRLQAATTSRQELNFTDSLTNNDQEFYYAIQAYTPWNQHPEPSRSVGGQGVAARNIATPFVVTRERQDGLAEINWQLETDGDSSNIAAFYVYRSYVTDGGRQLIHGPLAADTRQVTDTLLRSSQFYTVKAVDERGRAVSSLATHLLTSDSIPPPPPENLIAEADLEGRVTLAWDHSAADDVIGYRVFFSNAANRPGTRITDTMETRNLAQDSLDLRSMGDTVYYRVVALDERENVSDFSAPVALVLPDILPPPPPRLRSFTADTNGVLLDWAPSSADDVASYRFERRAVGTSYWATISNLPASTASSPFLDDSGRDDLRYEYRLLAVDEVGLRGLSNVLQARRLPPAVYPAVAELEARTLPAEGRIELRWRYPEDARITAFKIFRGQEGEVLTTYREVDPEGLDRRAARRPGLPAQWRFSDVDLRRGEDYIYAVQPVYRSGALGRLGSRISVAY